MKYKYKIDYKSIGGSSSISSTSSSASSDNTLVSTTFDDKIKYIDIQKKLFAFIKRPELSKFKKIY